MAVVAFTCPPMRSRCCDHFSAAGATSLFEPPEERPSRIPPIRSFVPEQSVLDDIEPITDEDEFAAESEPEVDVRFRREMEGEPSFGDIRTGDAESLDATVRDSSGKGAAVSRAGRPDRESSRVPEGDEGLGNELDDQVGQPPE